ncbi:MAG: DNA gyrase subunit A, partial [Gammaproteobacteria bacterium]|nr:DNA gyrase subunit A [Gammaproteobacteria bacterium]
STSEPEVLPARVPNLLVNGAGGIAVGMATNIPPHNLGEVIDACCATIDNPDITVEELMQYIPGPDFPTAGIINGRAGIVSAYHTGRGRIYMRAKTHIETHEKTNRQSIIITELPYQVNKAKLQEKIAELVKEKRIDGITAIRDESDKDGMRVVIEVRRGEIPEVIVNNLYTQTPMQSVFGINMVALIDGRPKLLGLKEILMAFIKHRREVVTRRSIYELRKARNRAHILEGLGIALANIDEMITLIKTSANPAQAKERLLAQPWQAGLVSDMLQHEGADICRPDDLDVQYGCIDNNYHLSPIQAQAILELRLHRLTGLEQEKIIAEYKEVIDVIKALLHILQDANRLFEIIKEELIAIKSEFGDERRTEIIASQQDLTEIDLITEEDVAVTLSHEGYIKAQSLEAYQAQRRGGRGKSAANVKDEDFIERLVIANTHDTILCFSSIGKVYWLKTYQLPQAGRTSRGKPIVNLLPLQGDEKISAILPVREYSDNRFVFMATAKGTVKKVALSQFSRPRANGIIALGIREGDKLIGVDTTDGQQDIMLFSNAGKAARFHEDHVRATGRTASGVRGIKLKENQQVIALQVIRQQGDILTATENGFGKRSKIEEYRLCARGGQGVISIQVDERNGKVVGVAQVVNSDDVMLISNKGTLVRTHVNEISVVGRNAKGVKLINLTNGEKLIGLQRIEEIETLADAPSEDSVCST